jgi:hypothetical protein
MENFSLAKAGLLFFGEGRQREIFVVIYRVSQLT